MRSGTSYNNPKDSGTTRIVAITGVDAPARRATGMTRERTTITINCAFPVGGMIVTPAVGEQWYVQKVGFEYTLLQQLPANSKELQMEASEGQVQVGSAAGPLTLHGSEVQVDSNLKLGNTLYRDSDGTLQNSTDKGATWTAIKGTGTSVGGVSSVSGRTGDVVLSPEDVGLGTLESRLLKKANLVSGLVPDAELPPPRVLQYADQASFPAEGKSNTIYISEATSDIFIWDGTQYLSIVGKYLDPLCNNDFIKALRGLGTGDTLIDKLATGLQTLLNQLWQTLFCNFTGNLTPTTLLAALQGISTLLSNNPLITGLTSLLANPSGALLLDSINGATEFIKRIVNALLCNLTGTITPQAILTALTDVLAPLLANPFLTGLRDFATAMGKSVTGLFDGAVSGATELVRVLTNLLTCGLSATDLTKISTFITNTFSAGVFNPAALLTQLKGLIDTITSNTWITMVKNLATTLGLGGANFIEQLLNGFGGGANWILKALKTYLPFIPWTTIFPFLPWTTIDATTLPTIGGVNLQTLLSSFTPTAILSAAGDFFKNIANFLGFDATTFAEGSVSIFDMAILFLNNVKDALVLWVNSFILGGHGSIASWAQANITAPIIAQFITGLRLDPAKLGITSVDDLAAAPLSKLGDIASLLLTNLTQIPAYLINGTLPPAVVGSVPVSSISNDTPNLITLGTFSESVSVEAADGWVWDSVQTATGSGGSTRVAVTSAKNRYLYSRQAVPVVKGDRLVVSATIKTASLTVSPTGSTPISIALVPFVGSTAQTPVTIGSAVGSNTAWTTIGNTTATPYEITNATWTSVIVRLGVASTATGGNVWWDDISLKKIGGLIQGNVDSLIAAWNSTISGLFGQGAPGTTYDWTSLFTAAAQARGRAETGITNNATTVSVLGTSPQTYISNLSGVNADGSRSIGTLLYYLVDSLGNPGAISSLGTDVLALYYAAAQARARANLGVTTAEGTNTTLGTSPQTLISNLFNVNADGSRSIGTMLNYLISTLKNPASSYTDTVASLYFAALEARSQANLGVTRNEGTNTALFGTTTVGTTVKTTALNTTGAGGIGATILPSAGAGATMYRSSGAAISATAGRKTFSSHGTFFNALAPSTSGDITSSTAAGSFTVTNAGWYLVEISFAISTAGTAGFNASTLLYKDGVEYKVGPDAIQTATRTNRYSHSSFIVYLTAGGSVQAGYDVSATTATPQFVADSTATYFSIALLGRTY